MITYTKRYKRVINWFKTHPIDKKIYQCEIHHIVPTSCGGNDAKENLVLLPVRWHYIVHCWLPLVYAEQGKIFEYQKMLYAWNRFQNCRKTVQESIFFLKEDSLLYKQLRHSYIELLKEKQKIITGTNNPNFNHHWWKDPNDKTKSMLFEEGENVPDGWVRGRWISDEQKLKCKDCVKDRIWYFNPKINKSIFISFSEKKNEELVSSGWIRNSRGELADKLPKIYTSDGKTRLKLRDNEIIPNGYILLREWNILHPKPKNKKTAEELRKQLQDIIKLAHDKQAEKRQKYIREHLPIWKEMYLWYLDHNKDFESAKLKFNYNRGKENFMRYIRIYLPEIYQFDSRKYKNPRPKIRGPYKKKNQNNLQI